MLDDLYQDHPRVQQFIHDRRAAGRANNTINRSLEKLRCVLNRATEWREAGKPWLQVAPKIRLLPRQDKTFPTASEAPGYPLSREQADRLMAELRRRTRTSHLADMVEFALYTGCRESEVTAFVHRLIDRFFEDIDLVLNWELLGYGKGGRDPWESQASNTQQDRFNKEFNERTAVHIKETLLPLIAQLFANRPVLYRLCPNGIRKLSISGTPPLST